MLGTFPPGRLSEIVGPWSSGGSSLLLALIARVTTSGGQVAMVDGADAFDPFSATAAGADLSALLWVKCGGRLDSVCRAADLLARCPGFALIAVDLGVLPLRRRMPSSLWLRLQRAVEGSSTVLVLRAPERLAGNTASLVISARRLESRWTGLPQPTRFAGLASELRILRSRVFLHPHPDPLLPVEGEGAQSSLSSPGQGAGIRNSLSPLGRGQGEGVKGEGVKGEGVKGEGVKGEGVKGEGMWTIEWRT